MTWTVFAIIVALVVFVVVGEIGWRAARRLEAVLLRSVGVNAEYANAELRRRVRWWVFLIQDLFVFFARPLVGVAWLCAPQYRRTMIALGAASVIDWMAFRGVITPRQYTGIERNLGWWWTAGEQDRRRS